MEIIKQEKINEDFGIVLQWFGREVGLILAPFHNYRNDR